LGRTAIFDLIAVQDFDTVRREAVERMLRRAEPGILRCKHIYRDAVTMFRWVCSTGFDGIVSGGIRRIDPAGRPIG